ncbi:DUF1799 domain-containing protein [Pararobbsia silviterrae]|nr:DUF1799 domain-containing protein [Pararobbsia silviterrae]
MRIDSGVVDALAAFGASQFDIGRANALRVDGAYEVYPENWRVVQLFLALSTQWRMTALSTMADARLIQTGFDYAAVEPVMRLTGIKCRHRAALFKDLQVMEDAVLEVVLRTND